jgi:hypothetical protein
LQVAALIDWKVSVGAGNGTKVSAEAKSTKSGNWRSGTVNSLVQGAQGVFGTPHPADGQAQPESPALSGTIEAIATNVAT